MATEAPVVTLYKNIRESLKDQVNHPETSAFNDNVRLSPFVVQTYSTTPYVLIVPEAETGGESEEGWQDVLISVYVVVRNVSDTINERVLTGESTGLDAIDSLLKVVRDALVRDEPYRSAPFNSGVYTQQDNVLVAVHSSTGAFVQVPRPGRDEEEPGMAALQIARPVTILYRVWDS